MRVRTRRRRLGSLFGLEMGDGFCNYWGDKGRVGKVTFKQMRSEWW